MSNDCYASRIVYNPPQRFSRSSLSHFTANHKFILYVESPSRIRNP